MRSKIAKRLAVVSSAVGVGVFAASPAWAQTPDPAVPEGLVSDLLSQALAVLDQILGLVL